MYVPRWDLGGSAALDFAVTSGLRNDLLEQTAADGSSCLTQYENFRNTYLDTAKQCREEGIDFVLMVMEAHSGAWGRSASKVLLKRGKCISLVSGELSSTEAFRIKQRLRLILHRETARAILRRYPVANVSDEQFHAYDILSSNG